MARKKATYTKQAKTLDEQIVILRSRGVLIKDEEKAKEYLSDIGYYRLGFYSFPFEITYPELGRKRKHDVRPGTTIEEIVALYYYDFDLRTILNRYLSRIEVSLRTTLIYELSTKYVSDPTWFVNPTVVSSSFISNFNHEVYSHLQNKPTIRYHHVKYSGSYAPAWKTMEFMTFGNLEILYDNLLSTVDKALISSKYGEPAIATFKSYMSAVREVRNACAHGNVVYEIRLTNGIKTGVACPSFAAGETQNLKGALRVIRYLLGCISKNRLADLENDLQAATKRLYSKVPSMRPMIEKNTGIVVERESSWQSICNYFRKLLQKLKK